MQSRSGVQVYLGDASTRKPANIKILLLIREKSDNMRTLNISISDLEFNKFGIRKDNLTFTEFVELISKELIRQNLDRCVALAEQYGLSSMTMDEINYEVKAVRNAKNRR